MNTLSKVMVGLALVLAVAGCTTYDIKACPPGAAACTEVHTSSWRQFEKPVVSYERKDADGDTVKFNFGADSATGSFIEQAAGQTLMQLPGVISGLGASKASTGEDQ